MKLYEFEGHRILAKVGIVSPFFVVACDLDDVKAARRRLKFPIVAKVQVLSGRRGRHGGVKIATTERALVNFCREMFKLEFFGEKVRSIQLAEKVDIAQENYISITYDTVLKIPFLLFSRKGGVDIEEIKKTDPGAIVRVNIDPVAGPKKKDLKAFGIPEDFALRLWDAFWRYDCRLVEVNPLVLVRVKSNVILEPLGFARDKLRDRISSSSTRSRSYRSLRSIQDDSYMAVDAKVILDDAGLARHKELDVLPKGAIGAVPSERELLAHEIDASDYRGTAGSKFIEFDGSPRSPRGEEGDIAVLASGGGASLMLMDAVLDAGGSPANYTEYSGNPPREKVEKLTKITLSRESLSGCLVAGAVANFTDIFETLSGFAEGLKQIKPKPMYPIVVRRGGPRQAEAYEMLAKVAKKEGFDIHLFGPETPISAAARKMVELSREFKSQKSKA